MKQTIKKVLQILLVSNLLIFNACKHDNSEKWTLFVTKTDDYEENLKRLVISDFPNLLDCMKYGATIVMQINPKVTELQYQFQCGKNCGYKMAIKEFKLYELDIQSCEKSCSNVGICSFNSEYEIS